MEIPVLYCDVCHSDIHQVKSDWHNTIYPCMPGDEVVGRAFKIGIAVTRHKGGDRVGVGRMIDSCGKCEPCRAGQENHCAPNSWLATYNDPLVPAHEAPGHSDIYGRDNTFGGYSNLLVVKQDFAVKIPASLDPDSAAPTLCAGVTTYSPLKRWGVTHGKYVGIVGFGALDNMGAKLAKAMGAHVTVFTRSRHKCGGAVEL